MFHLQVIVLLYLVMKNKHVEGEARHEASVIQQRQESKNVSLDNLFEQMKQGEMKRFKCHH